MELEKRKALVIKIVDAQRNQLVSLSQKIHSNPELGLQEVKASRWLTDYLQKNGFNLERGICNLPTAFRATYGQGEPVIAILAEYDALPKLGHACGHNLIGTSAVGAAVAAKAAIDEFGGTVMVIGTPSEELHGGKAIMAERGAFSKIGIAMMIHPGIHDIANTETLACQTIDIEFFGQPAHASAQPETGINALEAMLLAFTAINSMRQHIKDSARIHGIITDGGEAANIVPAHSAGSFLVRAENEAYLDELIKRVMNCFAGAAMASGARLQHRLGRRYAAMLNNRALAQLFSQNMLHLGREPYSTDPSKASISTDMGNVSQMVPAIHPFVAVASAEEDVHSLQFASVAASEASNQCLLDAAKALAMTVVDIAANSEVRNRIKEEFLKQTC